MIHKLMNLLDDLRLHFDKMDEEEQSREIPRSVIGDLARKHGFYTVHVEGFLKRLKVLSCVKVGHAVYYRLRGE